MQRINASSEGLPAEDYPREMKEHNRRVAIFSSFVDGIHLAGDDVGL